MTLPAVQATLPGDATVYTTYQMLEYEALYTVDIAVDVVELVYHIFKIVQSLYHNELWLDWIELGFGGNIRLVSWEQLSEPVESLWDHDIDPFHAYPWEPLCSFPHRVSLEGIHLVFCDEKPTIRINFTYSSKGEFEIQYTVLLSESDLERLWRQAQELQHGIYER